jgi:cytochrome c-type biogenesis protein CcmH
MRRAGRGRRALSALSALAALTLLTGAAADDPADRLKDPAKEARARALFREIRCLVCQNESIDESDADLAEDLRRIVRERVAGGATNGQIKAFLISRYGEFVLERPTFSASNAVLWGTPFLVVAAGTAVLFLRRRRAAPEVEPLSAEEEAKLADLTREAL